jgi:hypothetical protein
MLLSAARALAASNPAFQEVLGPGEGDRATGLFLRQIHLQLGDSFGAPCHERKICGDTGFAVDFYFPEEKTIVEIALGLPNPQSEFEKDVLKALIAIGSGNPVRRLMFISRAGGEKKCSQPGRRAVIAWAREKHDLAIEVHDLPGTARVRTRKKAQEVPSR